MFFKLFIKGHFLNIMLYFVSRIEIILRCLIKGISGLNNNSNKYIPGNILPAFLAVALVFIFSNDSKGQIIQIDPNFTNSRTFFISNYGNDSNSGLTEGNAWRTLKRISEFKFKSGDGILFRGGDLFIGNLLFNNEEGSDTEPIRISSYGMGRAVLRADSGSSVSIINNGGFLIDNIEISGLYDPDKNYSKKYTKEYNGITIFTYAKKKCSRIVVKNCLIRNFRDNAVSIGGDSISVFGYTSVTVDNNNIYNCGDIGIKLWGLTYQNILVIGNKIHDVKGVNPHPHGFTGNAISISHLYSAVLERNLIYNNGEYAQKSGGGIVTGESRNIIVRYNEIYGIKSNDIDGDAVDFDNGSDSCIAEYNYTHNIDGAGFLISGERNKSGSDNNIIRYNICKNNGLKNNHGAIQIYSVIGADNNRIYNNTVISTALDRNSPSCFKIQGPTTNTLVENNIFITVNSAMMIKIEDAKQVNIIFRANSYFVKDGMFIVLWGRKVFRSYQDFIDATGQEIFNSRVTGIFGNPGLRSPFTVRDTVNNAYKIDTMSAYKLYSFSPLINAGTQIQNNFSPVYEDFYGNKLTIENPPDIGANEY